MNEAIKPFIETLQECHLYQHVCNPTRHRDGQEPSLLDLILTNEEGMVQDLFHKPGLADSDHEILNFSANCYKEICSNPHVANYYKADYATMKNRLQKIEWTTRLRGGFLNAYRTFLADMETVMEGWVSSMVSRRKKKIHKEKAKRPERKIMDEVQGIKNAIRP